MERDVRQESDWQGRFPRNEIISLLDVNRRYNLAELASKIVRLVARERYRLSPHQPNMRYIIQSS
jgi:hypothetical protein